MPAGKTYVKIASQTLGSASSSLTFSNLPQDYTDLVLIINSQRSANSGNPIRFRFNSDSGSNYSQTNLYGGGSSAQSDRLTSVTYHEIWGLPTSTGISNQVLNIQNYSNRIMNKSTLLRGNNASQQVIQSIGLWRNTSPITAIEIFLAADNISSGSTFTLYGIECAKSPYAEGGDKVYSTGTHWVHEFYNSGSFVPRTALSNVDYLVIAGGGGGGNSGGTLFGTTSGGGGGGAGGFRTSAGTSGGGASAESKLSLNASTAYAIVVGAGGSSVSYAKGSDSSISGTGITTITSTGGGMGRTAYFGTSGKDGGSGGGGSYSGTAGTGTANQGFNGGAFGSYAENGGGGGGAGAAGTAGSSSSNQAGAGGNGVASSITGVSITYAGGGGGGSGYENSGTQGAAGGSGGGGAGGNRNAVGTAGSIRLGAGGGGAGGIDPAGSVRLGGNGGSGIVIVRYAV